MSRIPNLVARIIAHCERAGISPSTFGRKVVNDGKLVKRLQEGGTISVRTLERIERELASATSEAS